MRLLNQAAAAVVKKLLSECHRLGIERHTIAGATVIDCGVQASGSREAGRLLAEVSLAGLGDVQLTRSIVPSLHGSAVAVQTTEPLKACLASQYAGWSIQSEGYHAMASGPIRAAAGRERLFDRIGCRESPDSAVGVLEASRLPTATICVQIAEKCQLAPEKLTLLVAPTTSIAGTLQVVARSLETALHKLLVLDFDLDRLTQGEGVAPLPPVANDVATAIARTNDAILYGAQVVLHVRGDDDSLNQIGPQVPSSASAEHGKSFREIFARHNGDFYAVDPLLFSPARVTFVNQETGRSWQFGQYEPQVLAESFAN